MTAGHRQLYQFPHSHFSEKARWALDWKGLPFERVNLTRGPHVLTTRRLGPRTTVPVLRDGAVVVQDSTAILDHLEQAYPDPPLDPADPAERDEARRLEELFDETLGFHARRMSYALLLDDVDLIASIFLQGKGPMWRAVFPLMFPPMRRSMERRLSLSPTAADESEAEMERAFAEIDARVRDRDYLAGDAFSRADLTAAALLSLLTWPAQHDFRWPAPERMPPRLRAFRERASQRPFFAWAERMYALHRKPVGAAASPQPPASFTR